MLHTCLWSILHILFPQLLAGGFRGLPQESRLSPFQEKKRRIFPPTSLILPEIYMVLSFIYIWKSTTQLRSIIFCVYITRDTTCYQVGPYFETQLAPPTYWLRPVYRDIPYLSHLINIVGMWIFFNKWTQHMIQKILWYKFDDIVLLCYKDQFEFFSWTIKHHLT